MSSEQPPVSSFVATTSKSNSSSSLSRLLASLTSSSASASAKSQPIQNGSTNGSTSRSPRPVRVDYHLKPEDLLDIGVEAPSSSVRAKAIKERLIPLLGARRLSKSGIVQILSLSSDVLQSHGTSWKSSTSSGSTNSSPNGSSDADLRISVWRLYIQLAASQLERLEDARLYLFEFVRLSSPPQELTWRLELLRALTDHGKDIAYVQDQIGVCLLELQNEFEATSSHFKMLLSVAFNLIQRHSACLYSEVISALLSNVCIRFNHHLNENNEDELNDDLNALHNILSTSYLPEDMLTTVVSALCKSLVLLPNSKLGWKTIKGLLESALGSSIIHTISYLLQDRMTHSDEVLLRGAVIVIRSTYWGEDRFQNLKSEPSAVLPAFVHALDCNLQPVALQIVAAITCLVRKRGQDLPVTTWGLVMDVCFFVVNNYNLKQSMELAAKFHELITLLEDLNDDKYFSGSTNKLFQLVESLSADRPILSMNRLMSSRADIIRPGSASWLHDLTSFMEVFFVKETRVALRMDSLKILTKIINENRFMYEEQLIETVVVPFLRDIDKDTNVGLRELALQLLMELISSTNSCKRATELLEIVKRVTRSTKADDDVRAAIEGLITICKKKLYSSSVITGVEACKILLHHLGAHYEQQSDESVTLGSVEIRSLILNFFLRFRSNSVNDRIGIQEDDQELLFTPFLSYNRPAAPESPPSPPTSSFEHHPNSLPFDEIFALLLTAARSERHWPLLSRILQGLPILLRNKTLVVFADEGRTVNGCAMTVFGLIKQLPERMKNLDDAPAKLTKSDLLLHLYPLLSSLIPYNKVIDNLRQQQLVKHLEAGLSYHPRSCIRALCLVIYEMQETAIRLLSEVLLLLTKISATVSLAIPMLQFLSHLVHLPRLYASFVREQYMMVFAIVLPYTNPFKFDDYVVAMAHRVIGFWYLRCRIAFRKQFSEFIIKGLKANVMQPLEENLHHQAHQEHHYAHVNPHQTDIDALRRRSSSYNMTDTTPTKKSTNTPLASPLAPPLSPSAFSFPAPTNSDSPSATTWCSSGSCSETLNMELIDALMDLLSRYNSGDRRSVSPHRDPKESAISNMILDHGSAVTWLLGSKLITITTSGCSSRALVGGLCHACYRICKSVEQQTDPAFSEEVANYMLPKAVQTDSEGSAGQPRRRHQSAFEHLSNSNMVGSQIVKSRAFDDFHVVGASPSSSSASVGYKPSMSRGSESCSCWCQGWAEIFIRSPTGNSSWLVKVQNPNTNENYAELADLLFAYQPATGHELSETLQHQHHTVWTTAVAPSPVDIKCHSTPPVFRRTSSTPDMDGVVVPLDDVEVDDVVTNSHFKPVNESMDRLTPVELHSASMSSMAIGTVGSGATSKLSRASSLGRADVAHSPIQSIVRANSVSSRSPQRPPLKTVVNPSLRLELSDTSLDTSIKSSPSSPFGLIPITEPAPSVTHRSSPSSSKLFDISESSPTAGPHRGRSLTVSGPNPTISTTSGHSKLSRKSFSSSSSSSGVSTGSSCSAKSFESNLLRPAYIFLHMFYSPMASTSTERPLLLDKESTQRALRVFDRITPYETHKLGLYYVGKGQATDKKAILSNVYGSARYVTFLRGLGSFVRLANIDPLQQYVGGLTDGSDGKLALVWDDPLTQVVFHVTTLMPNKSNDPNRNDKVKHVGNDHVIIVYNESNEEFAMSTIGGKFTNACVIVTPFSHGVNLVRVQRREELIEAVGSDEPVLVSDQVLPSLVRQLALHADLASMVLHKPGNRASECYVSNSVERLRCLKRLKNRHHQPHMSANHHSKCGASSTSSSPPPMRSFTRHELDESTVGAVASTHHQIPFPDDFTNYV